MPNIDRPSGFSPEGEVKRQNMYVANAAIARGDMLKKNANGKVEPCEVGGAIHSGAVLGVAMSSASAADQEVLVCDDSEQEYKVQADESDIDAQTDIGLNYAIVGTNPASDESRQELDSSSGAVTATLPLRLVRISREINNAFGAQVKCIVKINANQNDSGVVGV